MDRLKDDPEINNIWIVKNSDKQPQQNSSLSKFKKICPFISSEGSNLQKKIHRTNIYRNE